MTGEDACPTTQDQRFTLDVGQATWPVGTFFSILFRERHRICDSNQSSEIAAISRCR